MGITEDLRAFVNKHRAEKGKPYTNTSIGNPKLSLYIPDSEYDQFINLYSIALTNGIALHYTEKPTNPSPLRVDLDFRFLVPDDKNGGVVYTHDLLQAKRKHDRIYTENDVFRIIDYYFKIINKYVIISDEANIAYIMEKPNPVEVRNKLKDGLHIVFPHIVVNNNVQNFIRKKIVDIAADMFKDLPVCNDYESIIDKAIIDSNCWQMYGSKKPDCDAYRVSSIYKYINGTTTKEEYTCTASAELGFIKLFSMRTSESVKENEVQEEFRSTINEYVKHILPSIDQKQKVKLETNIFGKSLNANKNFIPEDDFKLVKRLVTECLSHTRADNYNDWINLGWVLRNIDYRLLDTWIEFSKISSSYMEGECQTLWNKMRKDNMGMGTLRWWAKLDNIQKYQEIMDESIIPLIDICVRSEGAHYDVARVVHAQYKDDFKSISKDVWYKYEKHRHKWVRAREGLDLRLILSQDICKKFIERAHHFNSVIPINEIQKTINDEMAKVCLKIAQQLKNASFKDNIMKECRTLFVDDHFEELLDSRAHLIGFENGVYDLKMHMFRDGMPDDYITYTTRINYVPYNPESLEAAEINDFFSKIFTNKNLRSYILDILSCVIDGSIAQERFYIFTGQGSNGKSRLLDLIQKSVGDYYCILPIALLTQKRAASNAAQGELERTKGRRFAVMQEPSEQDKINIGLMKELSGNDKILTRGLYKEPFEFKPQFKMILTCNELPEVPSDDGGTWRRLKVCNFSSRFTENPNPNKSNEFPMDLELSEKFDRWTEMFISMLIDRHKTINPNSIPEPMEVRIATESYKQNNDVIGQFISDKIEINAELTNCRMTIMKLFSEMKIWCTINIPKGTKKQPDRNQLKAYFEKLLGAYPTDSKGWRGLRCKNAPVEDESDDE